MTHKHTGPHPSQCPLLTFSSPSCESPLPYLQWGLRRAAHESCSSSEACHTAHSSLSHEQTASPHSSRICAAQDNKTEIYNPAVHHRHAVYGVHEWHKVDVETQFTTLFFIFLYAIHYWVQWVKTEHQNISSECSKMARIMIGMSIRLPSTLRQEEISLTPHQWSLSALEKHLLHRYTETKQ